MESAEDGLGGTLYIFNICMYDERSIMLGQQRHLCGDTGWFCNNKALCEMLHPSEAAVHSCYEICDSILRLTCHSMQHNVK